MPEVKLMEQGLARSRTPAKDQNASPATGQCACVGKANRIAVDDVANVVEVVLRMLATSIPMHRKQSIKQTARIFHKRTRILQESISLACLISYFQE